MNPLELQPGEMLDVLDSALYILPGLLWKHDWNGLKITYEKPHVERLWYQWDDRMIFLHRLEPCSHAEAFMHPHPWASAVKILNGSYTMETAEGDFETCGPVLNRYHFVAGSRYEMIRPTNWHRVIPGPGGVDSIMVVSPPWPDFPKRVIESGLESLSASRVRELMLCARRRFN